MARLIASLPDNPKVNMHATTVRVPKAIGTADYTQLSHKPSIEGHVLQGDSSLADIGMQAIPSGELAALLAGADEI